MTTKDLHAGQKIGKLTLLEPLERGYWHCRCDCGNETRTYGHNLVIGQSHSCGNCGKNTYRDCEDGLSVEVTSTNGIKFFIDKEMEDLVRQYKWHVCKHKRGYLTVISSRGIYLHRLLTDAPSGTEVDHIDLDRLNNRLQNLRIVTHQQNQMNQPLQSNNTSGVSGVRYYAPRKKYAARIKISQHEIHLGYYETLVEATQARNVGMECMFGEYGIYNDVPPPPEWIRKKVTEKCERFAELSVCRAFLISHGMEDGEDE